MRHILLRCSSLSTESSHQTTAAHSLPLTPWFILICHRLVKDVSVKRDASPVPCTRAMRSHVPLSKTPRDYVTNPCLSTTQASQGAGLDAHFSERGRLAGACQAADAAVSGVSNVTMGDDRPGLPRFPATSHRVRRECQFAASKNWRQSSAVDEDTLPAASCACRVAHSCSC